MRLRPSRGPDADRGDFDGGVVDVVAFVEAGVATARNCLSLSTHSAGSVALSTRWSMV